MSGRAGSSRALGHSHFLPSGPIPEKHQQGPHSALGVSVLHLTSVSLVPLQTWDEELERSAAAWAQQCLWEHGPTWLMPTIGQNLAVHWGL